MFFNYFKDFFLKKKLKNTLLSTSEISLHNKVQTLGILVDETKFPQTKDLKKLLIEKGFLEKSITILAFKSAKDLKVMEEYSVFGWENIGFDLVVSEKNVLEFIQNPFDVLLSYYDANNGFLQWITNKSKAKFKVGFFLENYSLNHLMIQTQIKNYSQFVQEFVRVLQLIKKN